MAMNKYLSMTIIFWFVMLQAISPFVHAHLDLNHPEQNAAHLLNENHAESQHLLDGHGAQALSNGHIFHTIAVASGIKQDVQPELAMNFFSLILFCFCFAAVLFFAPQFPPPQYFSHKKSLKRRFPAPRAPPLA